MALQSIAFQGNIYKHGDIIVLRPDYPPVRMDNGLLSATDRLLLVTYSEQYDQMALEPITFPAARALAPEKLDAALRTARAA